MSSPHRLSADGMAQQFARDIAAQITERDARIAELSARVDELCNQLTDRDARIEALTREAERLDEFAEHKPGCEIHFGPSLILPARCPGCGANMEPVRNTGYLNDEQFDSVKRGDWFCEKSHAIKYARDRELPHTPPQCTCGLDAARASLSAPASPTLDAGVPAPHREQPHPACGVSSATHPGTSTNPGERVEASRFRAVGVPDGNGGISVLEKPTKSNAPGSRPASPDVSDGPARAEETR